MNTDISYTTSVIDIITTFNIRPDWSINCVAALKRFLLISLIIKIACTRIVFFEDKKLATSCNIAIILTSLISANIVKPFK